MPGATAGGLPYAVGTDPVRDGDNAIKNLADALELRGHGLRMVGLNLVGNFDANGLYYMNWSTQGITWSALPVITVTAKATTTGGDAGIHMQLYHSQNSAATLVVQAAYVKDGRMFSGNVDFGVLALGKIN